MAEVEIDRDLERRLARHPKVVRAARSLADEIRDGAQAIARAQAYDSGDYHDGLITDPAATRDGLPVGRVIGTDWKSNWIEFGTARRTSTRGPLKIPGDAGQMTAVAPIRTAAEALGLRFGTTSGTKEA